MPHEVTLLYAQVLWDWRAFRGRGGARLDDSALTRLRGRTIGFVFQYHYLLSAFTALENVMMPMLSSGRRGRGERPGGNLSGGQQQRVAIARALALNPTLILADEPTGNLDTQSAMNVFALLREVSAASGTTVLLVTHNMDLARRCDRTIELVDGKIISAGPQRPA